MRIYPKKLNNLTELENEKKALRERLRKLDSEQILSVQNLLSPQTQEKGKEDDAATSLLDLLPVTDPLIRNIGSRVVDMLLSGGAAQKANKRKEKDDQEGSGNSIAYKIAAEFIGGYLKWKTIELSFKGIRALLRRRRKKESR